MTAQVLNVELSNLIQESKRKNQELRQAAEKSLAELKALGTKPEAQIAADLSQRGGIIAPFLIACATKNAKFIAIAVVCLQRMVVSKALPRSRLKEVLDALREAANLGTGVDIQLKILQALPPLLQNYADDLQGKLVGDVLVLCSVLQGSKMGVVNNTAAATLQQLVISIFDKVVAEDDKTLEIPATAEAPCGNGIIAVRPSAFDAYRVFLDICLLTEGQKPQFLRFNALPQTFGLELIESVLTNHSDIFLSHQEQAHILRTRVVPLVIKSLGEKLNFPTTVRITRVLYILLRRHLSILAADCETAIGLLTHMLDPEAAPQWKRALCMEVFRGICSEPALIRKIFSEYDAKEGGKPIMRELVAALTRLATEKPSVIGLGHNSAAPHGQAVPKDSSSEQAALEAGGVAGIIGGAVGLGEVTVTGLSLQWSMIRVPCIDQLDKTDPPSTPESYIYCLTLACINSFSEGLAKFILPLTNGQGESIKGSKRRVHRKGSGALGKNQGNDDGNASDSPARTPSPSKRMGKRHSFRRVYVPMNPLSLESHPLYQEIQISAAIVEACWPALLASCSTFLYATLDSELYHALVRSFQKFAHVAGLLRLNTPRDAFLTTLGKAAVPSNILSANINAQPAQSNTSENQSMFSNAKGLLNVDNLVGAATGTGGDRTSGGTSDSHATLNSRNLLCLRALLNLGIALGPTLDSSWSIILETLQQADYIIFASSRRTGRQNSAVSNTRSESQKGVDNSLMANIGPELAAVEASATKMFETTKDFPDEAFVSILSALCKLLEMDPDSSKSPVPKSPSTYQKRSSSVSGVRIISQITENVFAIAKLGELAQINMARIIGPSPRTNGWTMLVAQLTAVESCRDLGISIRIKAAEVLNEIAIAAAKAITTENTENVAEVQKRILVALRDEVVEFGDQRSDGKLDSSTRAAELEIHRAGLDTLNAILEHSGQSLIAGWEVVFDIITSIFHTSGDVEGRLKTITEGGVVITAKSPRLIRPSFNSLQLICSDFLSTLPTHCILVLVDALYSFCSQTDDLNISLTTITFFWNVSDFLQTRGGSSGAFTLDSTNEEELMALVRRGDVTDINAALWMVLLLRLTAVSKDRRSEVRNGSIQTLFRIFDTYGHRLGPQAWSSCLAIVVFKMMDTREAEGADQSASERKLWDDTINLVLGGIGVLYSNYFDIFSQQTDFKNTWTVFIGYLEGLLARRSFEVNTTVFKVLANVLDKVGGPEKLSAESKDEVWRMWSSQGVRLVDGLPEGARSGIQDTLTAYVDAFKPLYKLLEPAIDANIVEKTLSLLTECVLYPDSPPYFQDTEILTPLQAAILGAMQIIRTDVPEVPTLMLKCLAGFSTVAYFVDKLPPPPPPPPASKSTNRQVRPTYVALAAFSMKQIEDVSLQHCAEPEIYRAALEEVLRALNVSIKLKYEFVQAKPGRKPLSLWRNATNTTLSILGKALPAMDALNVEPHYQAQIWKEIAAFAAYVVYVDSEKVEDGEVLRADEEFDIDAFGKLRGLIIPSMGRGVVPEEAIARYLVSVYRASLLYKVDIADPTLVGGSPNLQELAEKSASGRGKTSDLELQKRRRMSYVCVDELLDLFSVGKGDSEERLRLANLTAPYLNLRVTLILNNFISDQPLRGRMPQPIAQRKEMLYILRRLVDLDSISISSNGIGGGGGSSKPATLQTSKPHLLSLFSLLARAVGVAQGDQELLGWLARALGELSRALEGEGGGV
ncbi:hypothetical protein DFH27DRAFT_509927 [Peziza echinospora]|nr:hypothetical protein DFH27DRAFT_509927 [Peziza echinospora]